MALTNDDIQQIDRLMMKAVSRLATKDELQGAMSSLTTKFDSLETKFDSLETKVDNLEMKVDSLETKVDGLDVKIDNVRDMLEDDFRAESTRLTSVDRRLRRLRHDFNRHVSA